MVSFLLEKFGGKSLWLGQQGFNVPELIGSDVLV